MNYWVVGAMFGGTRDHGMREVAEELSRAWESSGATIHYIAEYYDNARVARWIQAQGIQEIDEGLHDNLQYTTQMMVVDPTTVRMRQRMAVDKFSINGVALAPEGANRRRSRKPTSRIRD